MSSSELRDILECPVCIRLLKNARTTPCGHSFCSACLLAVLDRRDPKCPLCRAPFHSGLRDLPVSKVLEHVVERVFPEEYQQLVAEEEARRRGSTSGPRDIPLFVMTPLFPGETMALNIFEPRYRLLVRRAMEGSRRFGMAGVERDGRNVVDVITEVEIEKCETQPDGRYHIEVRGLKRYTYDRIEYQEEYPSVAVAARVSPCEDEQEEDNEDDGDDGDDEERPGAVETLGERLNAALDDICGASGLSALFESHGMRRPSREDIHATCWYAAAVCTAMTGSCGARQKYDILKTRSLARRLELVARLLPEERETP